ncbi:hypothetical protein M406DRAFT_68152 [Cryphonectria parasitica EP155]|uniref:Transmembrane protein n=1 Tax=Cryphonectria parasitica (strain ATCC 38755 / EP155) TaxID=660469 RepID=A0A9P4Y307_CRYP1|nr:uncharacterized protein M406DRAFT_68152 [Cryphonectria parasitica EP155]KAF3765733.1 hypothetical protein M406DRAFT_68152 [Cryphonectria parasitica EP155]
MSESFFSYTVSRKYPYRWFTPVAIALLVIVTAVISFVNVITTGYELVAISSNTPNDTVRNPHLYGDRKWPSWMTSKAQATCADATIPLNSDAFTNNSAFPYTLQKVSRANRAGTTVTLGSLVYHEQPLMDCDVNSINIQVLGRYTQNARQSAVSKAGVLIQAYATCSIDTDTSPTDSMSGPTYFDLVASYNLIDPTVPRFLARNNTAQPSLYWGESLLQMYWMVFARNYLLAADGIVENDLYNAVITLTRSANTTIGTAAEVESRDFFDVSCFVENGNYCNHSSLPVLMQSDGGTGTPYPSIWSSVDILGKAMWFSVLTDLGRNQTAVPNMLVDPSLLANLTSNYTAELEAWPTHRDGMRVTTDPNLAQDSFDPNATPLPDLNATQSTFSINYLCQVPRIKSGGTLFFTVLVADFAFLHTAWTVLVLLVGFTIQRKDPTRNFCEGCQEALHTAVPPHSQQDAFTGKVETRTAAQESGDSLSNDYKGYASITQTEALSPVA